jgi:membrane associated rhomboid family serine protease
VTHTDPDQGIQPPVTTCYRHPKRESYVRCTRCDRYMCPDCMREAAVGHQCVECVREGQKSIRRARTVFGGRVATTTVPVVTYALIAVNLLVYAGELARPGIVDQLSNLGQGLIGPDGQRYLYQSAYPEGFDAVGIAYGEWYRLITSAFVHLLPSAGFFGLIHIVFNMYWLWILGRVTEEQLGRARFLALYLLSALGGSVLGYLIAPNEAAVGASGALFGLAAAYFVLTRRLHQDPLGANRLIVFFLIWMVVSAGISSWEGHLGGLLAGGATGLVFAYAPRKRQAVIQAAGVVAVLLVSTALVVLKTSQLTGSLL